MMMLRRSHRARSRGGIAAAVACLLVGAATASAQAPSGIDVSNWQGTIDWVQVARSGHSFAYAKATEGTTFTDITYPINRAGAASMGMRVGAYHFARPSGGSDAAAVASAIRQADAFSSFAQPSAGDLLPVLDLERTGGLPPARLTTWVQAFLDHVRARLGVASVIYVSPSFWKERMADSSIAATAGHRLWIAHWTKAALPILPGGGWGNRGWTFWQWTNCARVPGVARCVDGDRFNGESLVPVLVPVPPRGAPVSQAPPTMVGTPQVGRLLTATAGGWAGAKPVTFTFQWQRCTRDGLDCRPIPTATGQTYTPRTEDGGRKLTVSVTAQAASGTVTAAAVPIAVAASLAAQPSEAPRATRPPSIGGDARVGQTLTGTTGRWTGKPTTFAFQWRRCAPAAPTACLPTVPSVDAAVYTVTPDDVGLSLVLVVSATGARGTGSAQSALSPVVAAADVPPPALGSAVAAPGVAGAVTVESQTPIATWQPGAVPPGLVVSLTPVTAPLAQGGSTVELATGTSGSLPWPIDVRYPLQAPDVVAGLQPPGGAFWLPLAEIADGRLPPGQDTGSYRDEDNGVHVVTRVPGRIGLFAAGKWGDPRYTTAAAPRLTFVTAPAVKVAADGSAVVLVRFTIDSQAQLSATIATATGTGLPIDLQRSRLGWWLSGRSAPSADATQLRPGALPLRLTLPAGSVVPGAAYTLRVAATDPYGRRTELTAALRAPA